MTVTSTKYEVKKMPIDPRIRQRRNKLARSKGRRRLYLITAVFVVIGGYFAARALLRTPLFSIQKIEIIGSSHYSNAALISQSGISVGFPLTAVNPQSVATRVEELPWNGHVTVKKKWPTTLQIFVQSRVAFAVVPATLTKDLLVDSVGRVLTVQPISAGKFVRLCLMADIASSKVLVQGTGCEAQSTALGSYISPSFRPLLQLEAALRSDPVASFSRLAVSSSGEVDGEMSNGVVVRFGSTSQLGQKLRALQLLLSQASTAGYSTVDLRVPQEPVLSNW